MGRVHSSHPHSRLALKLLPCPGVCNNFTARTTFISLLAVVISAVPLLANAEPRDLLLEILEQVRRRYGFVVVGYVVMPEHVHLLIGEPERGDPSVVMQVLKQRCARRLLRWRRMRNGAAQGCPATDMPEAEPVWQRRFYDFVVWSSYKREEKLLYMHANPVRRGLVLQPETVDVEQLSSLRLPGARPGVSE